MKSRARVALFLVGALGLGALYLRAVLSFPAFGHYRGPYGDLINAASVPERHATDAVTAVNFDYRGFDTLGEEFILFVSVTGALVLLRQEEEKKNVHEENRKEHEGLPDASDAVRAWTTVMTAPTVLLGLYVVLHGQLTPGGGFQGGVILATAPLLIYLADRFETFQRVASHALIEVAEAIGALGFAIIGVAPLVWGTEFLRNFLPLGSGGSAFQQSGVLSGGTIPLISLTTGVEVAAGFVLLLYAFLQETFDDSKDGKK